MRRAKNPFGFADNSGAAETGRCGLEKSAVSRLAPPEYRQNPAPVLPTRTRPAGAINRAAGASRRPSVAGWRDQGRVKLLRFRPGSQSSVAPRNSFSYRPGQSSELKSAFQSLLQKAVQPLP